MFATPLLPPPRYSKSSLWAQARESPRCRPAGVTCTAKPAPSAAWRGTPTVPGTDRRARATSRPPKGTRPPAEPEVGHVSKTRSKPVISTVTSSWLIHFTSWMEIQSRSLMLFSLPPLSSASFFYLSSVCSTGFSILLSDPIREAASYRGSIQRCQFIPLFPSGGFQSLCAVLTPSTHVCMCVCLCVLPACTRESSPSRKWIMQFSRSQCSTLGKRGMLLWFGEQRRVRLRSRGADLLTWLKSRTSRRCWFSQSGQK